MHCPRARSAVVSSLLGGVGIAPAPEAAWDECRLRPPVILPHIQNLLTLALMLAFSPHASLRPTRLRRARRERLRWCRTSASLWRG
eukprot:1742892-Pleurochrysis_carterae.AAC.3